MVIKCQTYGYSLLPDADPLNLLGWPIKLIEKVNLVKLKFIFITTLSVQQFFFSID